jgi:hypothetical protein
VTIPDAVDCDDMVQVRIADTSKASQMLIKTTLAQGESTQPPRPANGAGPITIPSSADMPIPSIEDLPPFDRPQTPLRDAGGHQRTHSVPLSSTDSHEAATISTSSAAPGPSPYPSQRDRGLSSVDAGLQDLQLSDPYRMSEIAHAICEVYTPESSPARSLLSPDPTNHAASPTPSRRSPLQHRSSSRVPEDMHRVSDEEPPNDRFHQHDFQASFADTKALMLDLTKTLRSSDLSNEQDSVMKKLHERGKGLAEYECPQTRIVGFVGDSGVGKSSWVPLEIPSDNV